MKSRKTGGKEMGNMRHNRKRSKLCAYKTVQISVEAHHLLGVVAAELMQPIGRTVETFALSWAKHIGGLKHGGA
jgi:hypothetical protein